MYALAAALLLTLPPDSEVVPEKPPPLLYLAVQAVAIEQEILDPRELRYVMTREEDFAADLKLLRRRHIDLHDAPPLHDYKMFPNRELINELLSFNRAYRSHLQDQSDLEVENWWEVRESIQEADRLYQVWDTARDACTDYYYVTVRRSALEKLRKSIGYEAYCSGCLPPHVPVWRFQSID